MGTHGISKHEIITENFKLYETVMSLCRAKADTKSLSLLLASFATERKGAGQLGSPRVVTVKLRSCSFTVSCSVLSIRVQRARDSATSSSLKTRSRLPEQGHQDLTRANVLLSNMLKNCALF